MVVMGVNGNDDIANDNGNYPKQKTDEEKSD